MSGVAAQFVSLPVVADDGGAVAVAVVVVVDGVDCCPPAFG